MDKKKWLIVGVLITSAMVLLAFLLFQVNKKKNTSMEPTKQSLSVWKVYWDLEDTKEELSVLGEEVEDICHFAAYFNEDHTLFIPEATHTFFKSFKDTNQYQQKFKEYTHFLTIVNDKKTEGGRTLLKDTGLLQELLSTSQSRQRHIKEIIENVIYYGYDGIEIDYESLKKDAQLWDYFTRFIEELFKVCEQKDLKLRVVLEPSAPLAQLSLPKGPHYVMMAYNLHGEHSSPGPKANKDFILELIEKMELLESPKSFAFATGGFMWTQGKDPLALNEKESTQLIKVNQLSVDRDLESMALHFTFEEEGSVKEVWYADAKTLTYWRKLVEEKGYFTHSIWRLGGNSWK